MCSCGGRGDCETCRRLRDARERAAAEPPTPPSKAGNPAFVKFDNDYEAKPPMHLLPPRALLEIARVLGYGARKYAPGNWKNVDGPERYIAAAQRHLAAYVDGERVDTESGRHHLAMAACSLLFVLELELTRPGWGDGAFPVSAKVPGKPAPSATGEAGQSVGFHRFPEHLAPHHTTPETPNSWAFPTKMVLADGTYPVSDTPRAGTLFPATPEGDPMTEHAPIKRVSAGLDGFIWVPSVLTDAESLRDYLWLWHESGGGSATEEQRKIWTKWVAQFELSPTDIERTSTFLAKLARRLSADRISDLSFPVAGVYVRQRAWTLLRPYVPPTLQIDGEDPVDVGAWLSVCEILTEASGVTAASPWCFVIRRDTGDGLHDLFGTEQVVFDGQLITRYPPVTIFTAPGVRGTCR